MWVNTYRVVSPIAEFGGVKGSATDAKAGSKQYMTIRDPRRYG